MSHQIGNTYTKEVDKVVSHLQREISSAFVFVNMRRLLNSTVTALEGKLDKVGMEADVMNSHGKQGTLENFALIGIFCGKIQVKYYYPRVLVSTAASDLCVDHNAAQCVLGLEWPDCLASLVQRHGCASRAGQVAISVIVVIITSYLNLRYRIYEG